MTKRNSARSLDAIAEDIHKVEGKSIIDVGKLLLEAQDQCDHGEWLDWLDAEFDRSVDTAERYMSVARMADKFRTVRNLKVTVRTLYLLADQDEDDLPAIIKELAKHATKARLKSSEAERLISIAIGRQRFGDHPDATLVRLLALDISSKGKPWYEKARAALLEQKPESAESADAIIEKIVEQYLSESEEEELTPDPDDAEAEAAKEAEAILDDAPPVLPPPAAPSEPQKLRAETEWAETGLFAHAVTDLRELRTKPIARFRGMFTPAELREVADLLLAVASEQEKLADAVSE
jgi:hypothetical protein